MRTPNVLVGGRLEVEGTGAKFSVSLDGKSWQAVSDNLDALFPPDGPARYEYQLKCELEGPARVRHLAIINDLQMAPMALPEMGVGANTFTYSDQSTGDRKVRLTHEWVERSASRPPSPPPAAIEPPAGGESNGTEIVFRWRPSEDPDGDAIRDYQFELSNRADMRWPLSMGFYKLISNTVDGAREKSDAGAKARGIKAQYTLSEPGLLMPDQTYYWRVRALDSQGVWGDWSEIWKFTARGPAYPVQVTLAYDSAQGVGVLRWQPNASGRPPVKYRIYGSDEKGFSIADAPYPASVGITKEEMKSWLPHFPANFITETTATELPVLGPGPAAGLPAANKTYYRVVAVDAQGQRSGPSDYASAPRPVIYSTPMATAKAGQEYRYALHATGSLGDLSSRMKDGQQVSGYFDIEKPRFTLEHAPAWLKINETTGLLSGTPGTAGQSEVVVTARLEREVRTLDEPTLRWGNEKVLSSVREQVGAATQKFIIDVQ